MCGRSIQLALLLLLASNPLVAQAWLLRGVASADLPKCRPATAVLSADQAADTDQLAVSEEDGRFLRLLTASNGHVSALEIGGASGYSAIWIGLGLRRPAAG